MDVSSGKMEPDGQELLKILVSLTGLPEEWILKEIDHIMTGMGRNPREMTIDDLREALVTYLNSIHTELSHSELS